jgi:hypothetical protein
MKRPVLYIDQILRWADEFHRRWGRWPKKDSGVIPGTDRTTWNAVHVALGKGGRGLPKGSSLAQLLAERRGVRNRMRLPPLSVKQILRWADAQRARTGRWPEVLSGPIPECPGETWQGINSALTEGRRSLPGGSSLARLLAQERGCRNSRDLPALTPGQVLSWADDYHARTGRWPLSTSGPIAEAPFGETWATVNEALIHGIRGLAGYGSLARLLQRRRGVPNRKDRPKLTVAQILAWADAHHRRTGDWPRHVSGRIADAPGETWSAVEAALQSGLRGLPGGSSLYRVLVRYRGADWVRRGVTRAGGARRARR